MTPSSGSDVYELRLKSVREELTRRGLQGFVVPLTDEHLSEYVGAYAKRLEWLTGFRGSAGTAVVLVARAAIFVDGRYTLQLRQEVDARSWSCESVSSTSTVNWLAEHAPVGSRIGYDPWLHDRGWVCRAREILGARAIQLIPVSSNPIDAVWHDRPGRSTQRITVYPDEVAGQSSQQKRQSIALWLASLGAESVVLSALDSIAWTFNLRGQDIANTPVFLAHALVHADATADLYVAPEKVSSEVVAHLGSAIRVRPRSEFLPDLSKCTGRTVAIDPDRSVAAIVDALQAANAVMVEMPDPVMQLKAAKNSVEIAGLRRAHIRDGAALTRFLCWLALEAAHGGVDEHSAAMRLRSYREATGHLRGVSFDTISAAGPNAAIVHYCAREEAARVLSPGSLYLVDSGGQYLDGTTDVTRTVAIGAATGEMRDRFTRVLKGHIALASAVFPAGTSGVQLDALARQHLWAVGLDYAHGTGHGVGHYLSVHEGPQRIVKPGSPAGPGDEPLVPGMVVSNEPGYYKPGEYGIRIENLLLVVAREIAEAETQMLAFETLTLAPIDRSLIDVRLLTSSERAWIDSYHAVVERTIGALLDDSTRTWLMNVTRPLDE